MDSLFFQVLGKIMLGLFLTFILIFCLFSSCHFPPNPSKVRFRRQLLSILEGILGFDQFFIKGDYLYHQIRWISILCFLLPLFLSSGLGASVLSFVCQSVCLFVRRSVTTFYIECRASKGDPNIHTLSPILPLFIISTHIQYALNKGVWV